MPAKHSGSPTPGRGAGARKARRPGSRGALKQAARLFAAGRLRPALALCRRVLAARPDDGGALFLAGTVACRLGDLDEGIALLRRAAAAEPRHAAALDNLGNALAEAGRLAEAEEAYRRALAVGPRAVTYSNLGSVLTEAGRRDEAEAALRQAVALAPGHPELLANLGNLLMHGGRTDEAFECFEQATAIRRRPGAGPAGAGLRSCAAKLRHDAEQLRYLVARGILTPDHAGLAAAYDAALADLPAPDAAATADLPEPHRARLAPYYNRLLHRAPAPALAEGAINPRLDARAIEEGYRRNAPGIAVIDDLLTPAALEGLRRFCLESTVWFAHGFANGYLGAEAEDGFYSPLLAQVAEELRRALPGIMRDHRLCKAWAFKYGGTAHGTGIHADAAAVNVNFWVTPDAANLDPEGGGLVVWDREAPADWDFAMFNSDEPAIRAFLAAEGARPVTVPHRQNRAVLFNSDLFHETAPLRFRDGYESRRVNITLLYGERGGRE